MKTGELIKNGTTQVVDMNGSAIRYGNPVRWRPGPRAREEVEGPVQAYNHPYLSVLCTDNMLRKVRPGSVYLKVDTGA